MSRPCKGRDTTHFGTQLICSGVGTEIHIGGLQERVEDEVLVYRRGSSDGGERSLHGASGAGYATTGEADFTKRSTCCVLRCQTGKELLDRKREIGVFAAVPWQARPRGFRSSAGPRRPA